MSLFFSGFEFGGDFFTPSESRSPFNDHKQEKVNLSRLFTCRFLSAALLSLFVVPTLNAAPPGSTPPTYYWSEYSGNYRVAQTGPTPDVVAQAAASYHNAQGGTGIRNLQPCSLQGPPQSPYLCYGDLCRGDLTNTCTFGNQVAVWPRCSPGSQGGWDGTEFYCLPEPECDGPAQ